MTARQGFLLLHLAVLVFSLSALIGKTVDTPASVVTCLRSLIGAAAIAALIRIRQEPTSPWPQLARKTFPGGALLAVHWWSFFASIQLGSVALGLLTYASYPLFMVLLDAFGKRRTPRGRELLTCGVILLGLALVVPELTRPEPIPHEPHGSANAPPQAPIHALSPIEQLQATGLGLLGAFTFALLTLVNRKTTATQAPLPLVAGQMTWAGLLLLPLAGPHLHQIHPHDWGWLLLLGVVFTGVAHGCFTASLRSVPVSFIGPAIALEPVYGILFAALLHGAFPTLTTLAGASLIVAAGLLTQPTH
jgi:drug/metabolite transporter (DMT)-like permease